MDKQYYVRRVSPELLAGHVTPPPAHHGHLPLGSTISYIGLVSWQSSSMHQQIMSMSIGLTAQPYPPPP